MTNWRGMRQVGLVGLVALLGVGLAAPVQAKAKPNKELQKQLKHLEQRFQQFAHEFEKQLEPILRERIPPEFVDATLALYGSELDRAATLLGQGDGRGFVQQLGMIGNFFPLPLFLSVEPEFRFFLGASFTAFVDQLDQLGVDIGKCDPGPGQVCGVIEPWWYGLGR